jgi:hypothetical protein
MVEGIASVQEGAIAERCARFEALMKLGKSLSKGWGVSETQEEERLWNGRHDDLARKMLNEAFLKRKP